MFTGRSRRAFCAKACANVMRTRLLGWQASNALLALHPYSGDPIELVYAAASVGLVKLGGLACKLASTYCGGFRTRVRSMRRQSASRIPNTTHVRGAS